MEGVRVPNSTRGRGGDLVDLRLLRPGLSLQRDDLVERLGGQVGNLLLAGGDFDPRPKVLGETYSTTMERRRSRSKVLGDALAVRARRLALGVVRGATAVRVANACLVPGTGDAHGAASHAAADKLRAARQAPGRCRIHKL